MSQWPSTKARTVLAALLHIGWSIKRESTGSHRILSRPGWPDYVFAFHPTQCNPIVFWNMLVSLRSTRPTLYTLQSRRPARKRAARAQFLLKTPSDISATADSAADRIIKNIIALQNTYWKSLK